MKILQPVTTLVGMMASAAFFSAAQAQESNKSDHSHHHFEHTTTAAIPLNPNIVCGNANELYETQNECYSLYAANVRAYTESAAEPYMDFDSLEDVVAALEILNPTELIVKPEENSVSARFKNEEGKLHNPNGPAFIKINPIDKTYMEMRQINGNFSSTPDQPSYIKYQMGKEIDVQWDGPMGSHNPYGPAYINIDIISSTMMMDWSINGVPTSLNCEIGVTHARVNLNTNIAFLRETASGSAGDMQRRMHRNDGLHIHSVNPETGTDEYRIYRFHGDEADSDETTIEYFYDQNGLVEREIWAINGQEIPKIENFVPPLMTHHGRMHCIGSMDHDNHGNHDLPQPDY